MSEDDRDRRAPGSAADDAAGDNADADEDVDDVPLDEVEAAAGAEAAEAEVDESLDERIGAVIEELGDVTRTREGDQLRLAADGRVFALVGADVLEVALEGPVARAALATPDTRASSRGAGWVLFSPATVDRFALDRAEAWVRFAYLRASRHGG
jgi:hypothetical protein